MVTLLFAAVSVPAAACVRAAVVRRRDAARNARLLAAVAAFDG